MSLRDLFRDSAWLERVRERRRRGTRAALNWKYNFRIYVLVPLGFVVAVVAAVDLVEVGSAWRRSLGLVALLAIGVAVIGLVRYLRRPVDPDSARRRQEYYESMSFRPDVDAAKAWWRRVSRRP